MNNPKTLQIGTEVGRMHQDDGDSPKREKVKHERGKKVNVPENKGQLLLIFLLHIVINW